MPQIFWIHYFLEAQGFKITDKIVYEDNQSTTHMEKNGKYSSGNKTYHINICYCFATDQINADELSVEYCPTDMVLVDFSSKSL